VVHLFPLASTVAFAGSRFGSPYPVEPVVTAVIQSGGSVRVGCARGVDLAVRDCCPQATVLFASNFGVGKWSFAKRTKAVVAGSSALCVFPPASDQLGPGSSLALSTALELALPVWVAGEKPVGVNWQAFSIAGVSGWLCLPSQNPLF